jgi:Holliday junction DNA helicase RuvB
MNLNEKQKEALRNILEYEQTHDPKEFDLGWSWSDVRVLPATLNSLILKGLLKEKFHSNSYRGLLITELGYEQAKQLAEVVDVQERPKYKSVTLSSDLFKDIIGHDDVKELLKASLLAKKPVHVCKSSGKMGQLEDIR